MDYEKKYNEILAWAKKYKARLNGVPIEDIFPELRESENERMRRKTINCLTMHNKGCIDAKDIDECIAWLEKQKEQKPVEWTELTWKDIVELEGIINNVHYDFSAGIGQESFGKEVLERFRNKKDDVEVDACEQNPAWSEEDIEKMVSARARKSGSTNAEMQFYRQGIEDTIKSLSPQPKQEWSEEDERILKGIIGKIDHDQTYGVSKDEMLNFLKKL